jgi:hypothetical protein
MLNYKQIKLKIDITISSSFVCCEYRELKKRRVTIGEITSKYQ